MTSGVHERFALRSTRVLVEGEVRAATVVVDGERIAGIEAHDAAFGVPVRELGELVLFPALVDTHVHINEPGRTAWEGFATATRAAAAGGVGTLVDMPLNCIPVTTTGDALAHKLAACEGQLVVDVGFWGGVVPGNADALPALAAAGVLGAKAFLVHSGIDEFPNATAEDLRRAMPRLRAAGVPLLVHAELDLGAHPDEADPRKYARYLQSRPRAWEDEAIALVIGLCRETGCAVHIVHLSSASALPMLRSARAEGLPVTVETCAHYLCLCAEEVPDGQTVWKCAPPIREAENRERLWEGLREGIIDFVVTDHSPCTPELKGLDRGDFEAAWGGIASLALGLSSVWTAARERGFGLADLGRFLAEAPARFAGLGDRKGRIAVGLDADLLVWDPEAEHVVDEASLPFRHKISPYLGRRVAGRVHATYVRGQVVYGPDAVATPTGRPLLHRARGSSSSGVFG